MQNERRVVFLGTPSVAVIVLRALIAAPGLKVVAVVTQPPARSSRRGAATASPVHLFAEENGVPVLVPESAKDPAFLRELAALQPDLCVTAAYGNILPEAFLAIPPFGTLNVHPSLLPAYRGAAPVQRALEAGEIVTGVTIARTVKAMDAGPIVFQEEADIGADETAPALLERMFELGAARLVQILPDYFAGKITLWEQDHACASHARKMNPDDAWLDFSLPAQSLYNKFRAFFGWPGSKMTLTLDEEQVECKILEMRPAPLGTAEISFVGDALRLPAGNGTALDILQLQPAGKRALSARDFRNGLRGRSIRLAAR